MRNKVLKVIKKYAKKVDRKHDELVKHYRTLSDTEKHTEFIRMKDFVENQNI